MAKLIIHGLWQHKADGTRYKIAPSSPHNYKRTLHPTDISSLKKQLEQEWPNLLDGNTDFRFWEHEWKDHGYYTVWAPLITAQDAALKVKAATGFFPDIHTYSDTASGEVQILEIRMRYDNVLQNGEDREISGPSFTGDSNSANQLVVLPPNWVDWWVKDRGQKYVKDFNKVLPLS